MVQMPTNRHFYRFPVIVFCAALASCGMEKPKEIADAEALLPPVIDYNWHVRPILSDKCFACHGPQEDVKAGLQLHNAVKATAELPETPGKHAITPRSIDQSELYHRIISTDPSYQMPPPESHLTLSDREKAIFVRWIEQGAEYQPHWAFLEPKVSTSGESGDNRWIGNEIDVFIQKRLESEGVTPSGEASKAQLIRRLSFDLTGLPPTLTQINSFLEAQDPKSYEKVVDGLLASPSYGERMATYWLDLARYADTDGYLDDKHRVLYPWRDWVIDSFNKNMSYDQFVTWQLAGDLLPDANQEQIKATTFNRLHKKNSEAGIDFEEFRVNYVADRTDTFGTAFLGLSVGCARCHDHKYDPITQQNYYELFAFFNNTDEIGTAVFGPGQTPGPSLRLTSRDQDEKLNVLRDEIRDIQQRFNSAKSQTANLDHGIADVSSARVDREIRKALVAHYTFDETGSSVVDGKNMVNSPNLVDKKTPALLSDAIFTEGVRGQAFSVSDYNSVYLGEKIGWYERTEPFSIEFWVRPAKVYQQAAIILHTEEVRLGFKGYSLHFEDNRLKFVMANSWPHNAIQVITEQALSVEEWTHVTLTYDGSSEARGVNIYVNGMATALVTELDRLDKSITFKPDIHTYGFKGLQLGHRDKFTPIKGSAIDEFRIYKRTLTSLEVLHQYDPKRVLAILNGDDPLNRLGQHLAAHGSDMQALSDQLKKQNRELDALLSGVDEIMVMGDMSERRSTYILNRGEFNAPTTPVSPNTPNSILEFDERLPRNRLGLASWLFDPKNPLTARVFVNRIWQMHFGTGLVSTSDDFGNQGALPSHPELLDWLAVYFIESGWDIKALHKLIVMSSTYRQSSIFRSDLAELDPENRLLARGPSNRLEAEMIRDNALAVSGLLVNKIGGESQYPYQPDGLWAELSNKRWRYLYPDAGDAGEGLYRRSLYTFVKRSSPPPSMMIFDASGRDQCVVKRNVTSTPLQALVLLNDPQFVEASRVLAERAYETESTLSGRIRLMYRLLTSRTPQSQEVQRLERLYKSQYDRFNSAPDDVRALLSVGESDYDSSFDKVDLATLAVVANTVLNTYEAQMK